MGDRGSKLELEKAKLQFHHQKQEFKEQLAELASRIEHSHEPENDAQVQRHGQGRFQGQRGVHACISRLKWPTLPSPCRVSMFLIA